MKVIVYVLAGAAIVFVLALAGMAIWLMNESIKGVNTLRTEAARKARWNKPQVNEVSIDENKEENEKV